MAPPDPLAVPPDIKDKIGSDVDEMPAPAVGDTDRKWLPYYQEGRGEYRLRTLPPFWFEHVRGLGTKDEDRQSLYSLLYYQRRSARRDTDFLFPLVFRYRLDEDRMTAIGPFVHREAPFAHDNWVTPFVFEGKRKDGGYLHAPLGLLSSHWSTEGAFTCGPYFPRAGRRRRSSRYFTASRDVEDPAAAPLVPPLASPAGTGLEQAAPASSGPPSSIPIRANRDRFQRRFFQSTATETGGIRETHDLCSFTGVWRSLTATLFPAISRSRTISAFYSHAISARRRGRAPLRRSALCPAC
jgi:hypothetical protein